MKSLTLDGMSNPQAWLTPESAPALQKCWRVLVPDGEKWEAAFRGAMALLAMAENWEQFGTLTPEETAQEFIDTNFLTYEMRPCVPVGSVMSFAGDVLPDGWLWCDGALYNKADEYQELYAVIGTIYGGTALQWKVPDMHNRFVFHKTEPTAVGGVGGKSVITLAEANLPSHNHSIPGTVTTLNDIPVGLAPVLTPSIIPSSTGNTGSGDAFDAKPPYIKLRPIIRAMP